MLKKVYKIIDNDNIAYHVVCNNPQSAVDKFLRHNPLQKVDIVNYLGMFDVDNNCRLQNILK